MLRRRGLAVGIIDHVTKARDARGGYSIGAQHKKEPWRPYSGRPALGGVGAGVIGSLTELPEMLPAERRVEAEREESWRTTEHERWREFVRATEALDPH